MTLSDRNPNDGAGTDSMSAYRKNFNSKCEETSFAIVLWKWYVDLDFFFLLRIWMRIMKTNFEWPQASWREHSAVTGTWNQSQINWFQNWNLFTMQLIFFGRITLLWQVRHSVLTAYDERGLFTKRIADENSFVPILVAAIDYTSSHAQLIFPFINLFLSAIVEHKQWPYTVRTCMQLYGYGMVGER